MADPGTNPCQTPEYRGVVRPRSSFEDLAPPRGGPPSQERTPTNRFCSARHLCAPCHCTVRMILLKHAGVCRAPGRGRASSGARRQAQGTERPRAPLLARPPDTGGSGGASAQRTVNASNIVRASPRLSPKQRWAQRRGTHPNEQVLFNSPSLCTVQLHRGDDPMWGYDNDSIKNEPFDTNWQVITPKIPFGAISRRRTTNMLL
jgi:hypothetical protein